jgi:hypothetical protein
VQGRYFVEVFGGRGSNAPIFGVIRLADRASESRPRLIRGRTAIRLRAACSTAAMPPQQRAAPFFPAVVLRPPRGELQACARCPAAKENFRRRPLDHFAFRPHVTIADARSKLLKSNSGAGFWISGNVNPRNRHFSRFAQTIKTPHNAIRRAPDAQCARANCCLSQGRSCGWKRMQRDPRRWTIGSGK